MRAFDQFDLVPTDCTRKENVVVTIVIYQKYFLNETDVKKMTSFLQRDIGSISVGDLKNLD